MSESNMASAAVRRDDIDILDNRSNRLYDLTIFGVTGYTGKLVAQYLETLLISKRLSDKVRICFAGREEQRLQLLAKQICPTLANNLAFQYADVSKPESIYKMASDTKVILTCVGPYHIYGEIVIKACVSCRADYVDITGETRWVESMRAQYDQTAKQNNVLLVPFAGNDSVPADVCAWFATSQIDPKEMEDSHATLLVSTKLPSNGVISHGTFQTLLTFMELGQLDQWDEIKVRYPKLTGGVQLVKEISESEGGPLAIFPDRFMPDGKVVHDTHTSLKHGKPAIFESAHSFVVPNRAVAYAAQFMMQALPYLVKIPFVLPALRRLMESGNAIGLNAFRKPFKPGFQVVYSTFAVLKIYPSHKGRLSQGGTPLETIVVRLDCDREPYAVTAVTCAQIALALANDETRSQCPGVAEYGSGFQTPVNAIGGQAIMDSCNECFRAQLVARL